MACTERLVTATAGKADKDIEGCRAFSDLFRDRSRGPSRSS